MDYWTIRGESQPVSSLCHINLHWTQVRYHHDGKYNVLSLDGPFEVYGVSNI
jgi:hypothetical protein